MPFQKLLIWIKKHTNIPSILVGDFNMFKSQLEGFYLINHLISGSLKKKKKKKKKKKNLTDLDFIWARDGKIILY